LKRVTELSSVPPPPASTETVLVAEPEILVRVMVSHYLRECGYKVIEACDGDEALLILQAPDVRVDVVFCVVGLPGTLDGFGLSRWIRANLPDTQVILASNATRTARAAGELCEEGPLMKKPYDHQLLADSIKQLLAARGRK
jgi:CheY-like chemotaxis protein